MNKALKILIVVESLDENHSSGIKGRLALIKNLREAGCSLKVLHFSKKNINIEGINCVEIKERTFNILYFLSRIQRTIQHKFKLNLAKYFEPVFGFSFTFLNDVNSIVGRLKKESPDDFDYILTMSFAASFRPHKAVLKLEDWHAKWIAYVHDPYPMHSYPRPYDWVEPGHKWKRAFFVDVYKKASYLMYPSKYLAEWMRGYFFNDPEKEIIVPHQIAPTYDLSNELPDYFKSTDFNILHAGSLMDKRNPEALISAFNRFLEANPESATCAKLIFIGHPSPFDTYIDNMAATNRNLVNSKGYVPFNTVLAMQHGAAVNVILESTGPISPFLPGKFPHCVNANKPILLLGPSYSECRRLLGDDYPYWAEVSDNTTIEAHIAELYNLWKAQNGEIALNRPDLNNYLSLDYLKETLNKL